MYAELNTNNASNINTSLSPKQILPHMVCPQISRGLRQLQFYRTAAQLRAWVCTFMKFAFKETTALDRCYHTYLHDQPIEWKNNQVYES